MPPIGSLRRFLFGADRRALLLVISWAVLLSVPFLAGIVMLDEGALVHVAERILDGEVLYRDVATGVMPGSYYLQALVFAIFGPSLLVGRVLMILMFTTAVVAVFLMLRQVTCGRLACLGALGFAALSAYSWRYPNYSPQAVLLILGMLWAGITYVRTRRYRWLVISGLLLGLALIFKQNYGALASLGLATGLLAATGSWRRRLRDVAVTAGMAAVPLLATVLLLWLSGAWSDLWHYTVVVPLGLPSTAFARGYPKLWGAMDDEMWRYLLEYLPFPELFLEIPAWVFGATHWSMAIVRVTYYLPPCLLGVAVVAWILRRRDADRDVGALVIAVSAFLFLGVFPRVDAQHLILVLAPWFVTMGWLAGPRPGRTTLAVWGTMVAVVMAVSLASQVAVITDAQPQRIRDAWLPLPRGGVWVARATHQSLQRALREVDEQVPPEEPLFVAPAAPMYYFLALRQNPTRYPLILPGAMDEEEVVRELASTRWGLLEDRAFDQLTFESAAPRVWEYLTREFRLVGWDGERTLQPPYLAERAAPYEITRVERVSRVGNRIEVLDGAPTDGLRFETLMETSLSPAPPYAVAPPYPQPDPFRLRVFWWLSQLQPALVANAPWGRRKLLITLEAPVEEASEFRFACTLDPVVWETPGSDGQGGIAEIWLTRPEGTPRRVWRRWMDPRRRETDRRWFYGAIDLPSFAPEGTNLRITLVSAPSPAFHGADARVVWKGLGFAAPRTPPAGRFVETGITEGLRMVPFGPAELRLLAEAVDLYGETSPLQGGMWEVALHLMREVDAEAALAEVLGGFKGGSRAGEAEPPVAADGGALRALVEMPFWEPNQLAALASVLAGEGEWDLARRAVDRALERQPEHPWALRLLASLELQAGNRARAVDLGRRAAQLDPSNPRSWIDLARILRATGEPEAARTALGRAAELGLSADVRSVVALEFLRAGDASRARKEARRATLEESAPALAWTVLAQVREAEGDLPGAREAWRRARELAPERFEDAEGDGLSETHARIRVIPGSRRTGPASARTR
jgi:Tfp pilus assembly protein PilF